MSYISAKLRQKIVELAKNRCGYCLGEQRYIFAPLELDHLLPTAKGGSDGEENLWLACPLCNRYKGINTDGIDPLTRRKVSLFNPRKQDWKKHFSVTDGINIVGRTASGRATVIALQMNNRFAIAVRQAWVVDGWYPPEDL